MREFAEAGFTPEGCRERAERARAYLAEHFGHYVTDEEAAEVRVRMSEAVAACHWRGKETA
ncbi:hypothetical protein ACFU99_26725 [Streptomyces sp. NPDC057654]|uniref:hypothetical protein n=1 Tax=Streptomyces sp. NPDC057654 TaxID=3346196 RepID=UPI00369B3D90